jgi:hypothetical protein
MNGNDRWTAGWLSFTAWLMITIGGLYVLQGLIALIRDRYYVLAPDQIIVFDLTTWGWIMLIWGIVVGLTGFGLLAGAGWARWVGILVVTLSILVELSFAGAAQYTLWALTVIAFCVIALYVLLVRWDEARPA